LVHFLAAAAAAVTKEKAGLTFRLQLISYKRREQPVAVAVESKQFEGGKRDELAQRQ